MVIDYDLFDLEQGILLCGDYESQHRKTCLILSNHMKNPANALIRRLPACLAVDA